MQYNPSMRNTCTVTSDETERRKHPYIKDYGAYYRGFYDEFKLDADQRTYYVLDDTSDASKERVKKLFAILFDFDEVHIAVVLPFVEFLRCADAVKANEEIVRQAIDWRKKNIEEKYPSKSAV